MEIWRIRGSDLWAYSVTSDSDPMDCNLPDSSVHGIFRVRILEWVAISSSSGSSWYRDWTWVSCSGKQVLYPYATWESNSWARECQRLSVNYQKLGRTQKDSLKVFRGSISLFFSPHNLDIIFHNIKVRFFQIWNLKKILLTLFSCISGLSRILSFSLSYSIAFRIAN